MNSSDVIRETNAQPVAQIVLNAFGIGINWKRKAPMVVTKRIYEANVLFGVAVNSAASIQAPVRAGGQLNALVSLVFSAISVEAFLNEAAGMAVGFAEYAGEPQEIAVFAKRMADAEEAHESFESKLALAYESLGEKLNKSVQPYQDFSLIVGLRNALVHFKGNERFDPKATPEEFHKDLIKKFGRNKRLLAEDMEPGSWIHAIETKAIANWSCKTAARVVVEFVSKAPQGVWRSFLEGIHSHFKPYASSS